ncbi:MAG: hypothetical protein AMXMBFR47_08290 [Planctomycetota bacterium]
MSYGVESDSDGDGDDAGASDGQGFAVGAFIFLCDLTTEQECLDRSLFGTNAGEAHRHHYSRVAVGDTLFLYNLDTGQLRGPFTATTECRNNIEPQAWKKTRRSFPWQVRVDAGATLPKPLTADTLTKHVPLASTGVGVLPPSELTTEQSMIILEELSRANSD